MVWKEPEEVPFAQKVLWGAVIRRAVADYVLYKGQGKHKLVWQRACQFLFGDDEFEYEYEVSFEDICEIIGWNPDYIRRLTRSLKRENIQKFEVMKLRAEFNRDPMGAAFRNLCWKTGAAVPFFTPVNFSSKLKKHHQFRDLPLKKRPESFIPMGAWSVTGNDGRVHR